MSSTQSQVLDLLAAERITVDDALRLLRAMGREAAPVRQNTRKATRNIAVTAPVFPAGLAIEQYDGNIILR